jgi:hypothetical protein
LMQLALGIRLIRRIAASVAASLVALLPIYTKQAACEWAMEWIVCLG